jgi:hypothetical protein
LCWGAGGRSRKKNGTALPNLRGTIRKLPSLLEKRKRMDGEGGCRCFWRKEGRGLGLRRRFTGSSGDTSNTMPQSNQKFFHGGANSPSGIPYRRGAEAQRRHVRRGPSTFQRPLFFGTMPCVRTCHVLTTTTYLTVLVLNENHSRATELAG